MASAALLLGLLAIATVGVFWADRRGSRHGVLARLYRASGRSLWSALVGGFLSWSGLFFIAGWFVVHYPHPMDTTTPDQPAPDWLWQLGAVMVVAGVVVMALALLALPAHVVSAAPSRRRPGQAWPFIVVALIGAVAPLLTAAAVSSESKLAVVPLLLLVPLSVSIVLGSRTRRVG